MNSLVLLLNIVTICGLTLFALRYGIEIVTAWLSLLAVAMNLFVLKQITLFGLSVTSSDALAVGYLLGLNLIQEFFGRESARRCVYISFFISCSFVLLAQINLFYSPNHCDVTHNHFLALFHPIPRIFMASLFSFLIVQFLDIAFFNYLRKKTEGKYLTARTTLALLFSQTLDTLLFSYLGLYGLVASVEHIIYFSLAVKGIVILLSTPFIALSKKIVQHVQI